ncbi:hypothetical protein ITG08_01040 [Vibrio cyclitrophicus]|nr:hypothetical protein ITG08_01040 [Vibrio cyclitrophicus]UPR54374.1 hypothetical protein ITG09_23790 [Vibrio cyclitrophicus]UPR59037.1 hypothetical protein ITG10_25150 [Vibrio sp. ED004]UWZ96524.1 hypothetical protein IM698_08805 [Vibrio splendidus]
MVGKCGCVQAQLKKLGGKAIDCFYAAFKEIVPKGHTCYDTTTIFGHGRFKAIYKIFSYRGNNMKKVAFWLMLVTASLVIMGCSAKQASRLGFRQSTVTRNAQQMSNIEVCEVQLYRRSTTQSRAAVASEWSRRKLSRSYCDDALNELYIATFTKWLMKENKSPPNN